MNNQTKKLIELIQEGKSAACDVCKQKDPNCDSCENQRIAETLLLNGIFLPGCKVNDTVFVRATCSAIDKSIDDNYITGTGSCPFEDICEFDICSDDNESIFETQIEAIYNSGHGWKAALKSFNIAADLEKDIGTSIFFTREEAERKQVEYENKA